MTQRSAFVLHVRQAAQAGGAGRQADGADRRIIHDGIANGFAAPSRQLLDCAERDALDRSLFGGVVPHATPPSFSFFVA